LTDETFAWLLVEILALVDMSERMLETYLPPFKTALIHGAMFSV
jgi:hypothetical protein